MIPRRIRENNEFGEEDDFIFHEIVETISIVWELFENFLNLIGNCILFAVTSKENLRVKYNSCVRCFHLNDVIEPQTNMSTSSACRRLKSSISGNCSFKGIQALNQGRICRNKNVDDNIQAILNNQLEDISLLDSDVNNNGADPSMEKNLQRTTCRENTMKGKTELDTDKKEEIEPCKIAHYREALLKYSRITFADFTSLFNKFVRENGRDFSKTNLLHWFDKFTKFIYLKKMISGEPTDVREQLSFRAIQNKRNSLAERLYNLREPHEMGLTLQEFCEHLKNSNIHPINKLLNLIKGSGDTDMLQHKENVTEKKCVPDGAEQGRNSPILVSNESIDTSNAHESSAVLHISNEIRTETIDLELENASHHEKVNNHQQQTTSKVKNRKKGKSKPQKSKVETNTEDYNVKNKFETIYLQPKMLTGNYEIKSLPPVRDRDESKCVNSTIYITRNGFVKVSQHIEIKFTKNLPGSNVFEQSRSVNYYVDHLDEKDPLPPGIEVKPLPPGGLEEVLRTVPPMTDEEYAEFDRVTSLHAKGICPVHMTNTDDKTKTTIPEKSIIRDVSGGSASQSNETESGKAQTERRKAVPKYKLPKSNHVLKKDQNVQQCVVGNKSLRKSETIVPMATEEHNGMTNARLSNIARPDQTNSPGTKLAKRDPGAEPDDEMRRIVQARRRLKSKVQDTVDSQSNEMNDAQVQGSCPKVHQTRCPKVQQTHCPKVQQTHCPKVEHTDYPKVQQTQPTQEQKLFDELPPLNFIDTDTEIEASKKSLEPAYLETNATIDYSRLVVEPSHGDRPNKKKLQAVIKEKIKTKGEANKHLKAKQDKPAYYFDEDDVDTEDVVGVDDSEKDELQDSVTEQTEESVVVCATDQPQILDNREYMMVPEEIIRLTDPRLKDIEDKYSIAAPNDKKDKKKRKDKKNKAKMTIPINFI